MGPDMYVEFKGRKYNSMSPNGSEAFTQVLRANLTDEQIGMLAQEVENHLERVDTGGQKPKLQINLRDDRWVRDVFQYQHRVDALQAAIQAQGLRLEGGSKRKIEPSKPGGNSPEITVPNIVIDKDRWSEVDMKNLMNILGGENGLAIIGITLGGEIAMQQANNNIKRVLTGIKEHINEQFLENNIKIDAAHLPLVDYLALSALVLGMQRVRTGGVFQSFIAPLQDKSWFMYPVYSKYKGAKGAEDVFNTGDAHKDLFAMVLATINIQLQRAGISDVIDYLPSVKEILDANFDGDRIQEHLRELRAKFENGEPMSRGQVRRFK